MARKKATHSQATPLFDPDRVPPPEDDPARPESSNGTPEHPLSVAQLARGIGDVLDTCFPVVWVVGQVSGYKRAASGHLYFDLKDDAAVVQCVMWKSATAHVRGKVDNGTEVLVRGRVSFYAKSGRCQLYADRLEPRGLGELEVRFRELKARLETEGLFAAERKKPLPPFPETVVLVTSPTGAAVRDMIHVLSRRWPAIRIQLYPVPVQGAGAADRIARAIRDVDRHLAGHADLVIVGRGGGSAEDLWAFNEEAVARAIAECRIPVISAVGHETDFSISDFVADVRAPTPSAAAEMAVPDFRDLLRRIADRAQRLRRTAEHTLGRAAARWQLVSRHRFFRYPEEIAGLRATALDDLVGRCSAALRSAVVSRRQRLHDLERGLMQARPAARVAAQRGHLAVAVARHRAAGRAGIERAAAGMRHLVGRLEALSPLAVLDRGYSITLSEKTGRAVRGAAAVAEGDLLETIVANRERIRSTVVDRPDTRRTSQ